MQTGAKQLIDKLIADGVLTTPNVIDAFSSIDRKDFVLPENEYEAYFDYPIPIGYEQTISQPFTVAFMLNLLQPKNGDKVLDVGSGSGWTTALLGSMVGNTGSVYGVERFPELVTFGKSNIAKYPKLHTEILKSKDNLGLPDIAPFNKILVSASSDELPKELIEQLHIGGTMIIPIRNAIWKITHISKTKNDIEKFEGFAFVPLIKHR